MYESVLYPIRSVHREGGGGWVDCYSCEVLLVVEEVVKLAFFIHFPLVAIYFVYSFMFLCARWNERDNLPSLRQRYSNSVNASDLLFCWWILSIRSTNINGPIGGRCATNNWGGETFCLNLPVLTIVQTCKRVVWSRKKVHYKAVHNKNINIHTDNMCMCCTYVSTSTHRIQCALVQRLLWSKYYVIWWRRQRCDYNFVIVITMYASYTLIVCIYVYIYMHL